LINSKQSPVDGFAKLDFQRAQRAGFPEAVFGSGKTPEQIALILDEMAAHANLAMENGDESQGPILATRIDAEKHLALSSIPLQHGSMVYHSIARIVCVHPSSLPSGNNPTQKKVVVACAGTTDVPVAEEAAVTLESAKVPVERIYDVGVAGLHRILGAVPRLRDEEVGCVIVCAGMDGALPSVVAGLVSVPVVAVPTSVGYGAAFGGVSALLTMLNSCAPGVGVVNIDNGFGGAALAYKILI